MELNNVAFHSQYSAADAPKVLFHCIENCTKIAILGQNPFTDYQLIDNAIPFLLTTGLYQRLFEEWDRLLPASQTWIALQALIQEAFQCCLNATAPTAGHHGYAPAHSYQQNALNILGKDNDDDEATTASTQVGALTYQSQLTQSMAANTSQQQEHQMAQLSAAQDATHVTLHQLIDNMNALAFNVSDAGRCCYVGRRYGGHGRGCGCMQSRGCGLLAYIGGVPHGRGFPQGDFPPTIGTMGTHPGPPGGFQDGDASGPPPYCAPPAMNGRYGPTGGYGMPPGPPGMPLGVQANVQPPYLYVVKCYSNWNVCYSCSFNVTNGHTSMLYLPHLHKATQHIGFNCQNTQQYINLGHPRSTRNRHKMQFLTNM
jgi:hypothetical protein